MDLHAYWRKGRFVAAITISCVAILPASAQNRFMTFRGMPMPMAPPPRVSVPALQLPDQPCPRTDRFRVDLSPIECVAGNDITAMVFHVSGLPLSVARPEVQTFIAGANQNIELAKSGHRFSDQELGALRSWRNESYVERAIGYPPLESIGVRPAPGADKAYREQWAIDAAFIDKALKIYLAIDETEMRQRAQDATATEVAEKAVADRKAEFAKADLIHRAKAQCGTKILTIQDLAIGSPFATKGKCYELPMVLVSQWLGEKSALANMAMSPIFIDFQSAPATKAILSQVIVKGEGAYQYTDTTGAFRTVPRVLLVAQ